MGQFDDDRNCSKLRTTFAQYTPAHILYDRRSLSKETRGIIELQSVVKEALAPGDEMLSGDKVLRLLTESEYFKANNGAGEFKWPDEFAQAFLSEQDTLGLTPRDTQQLAVNAFGGLVWYLRRCLIDVEVLSTRSFQLYQPVDNLLTSDVKRSEMRSRLVKQRYMVLDSISLTNLEIIENNYDGTTAGTLFEQLDHCSTNFGKRLLKYWICNPLVSEFNFNHFITYLK